MSEDRVSPRLKALLANMENFVRSYGQLILVLASLIVSGFAFVRSNDMAYVTQLNAENTQAIQKLEDRLQRMDDIQRQMRDEQVKTTTLLQLVEKRTR